MSRLRIEEIIIPEAIASDYGADPAFNSLRGIKRLNAFVGPNNSGKSRLLREMFLAGPRLLVSTDNENARLVRKAIRQLRTFEPDAKLHRRLDALFNKVMSNVTLGFHACTQHIGTQNSTQNLRAAKNDIQNYTRSARPYHTPPFDLDAYEKAAKALNDIERGLAELAKTTEAIRTGPDQGPAPLAPFHDAKFIYIPTLRGMRLGVEESESAGNEKFAYFDRTWVDYMKGRDKQSHVRNETLSRAREQLSGKTVVTGLDFYDVLTDRLLGGLQDREFIREFQEYLSRTFFRGEPVALIPRRDHDTVNIKVGNEKERPVQSLGDGLQQLIILTLPLFEHRNVPLFLFIEEPDLFLHPGFQRVLIDAITQDAERSLYVFVTTHSSQFLDITISEEDCTIFRCNKLSVDEESGEHDPRFSVENAIAGDYALLQHIGVRPSSVMFSNCTIWVEGITDRLYFGRYVELLLKKRGLNYIENLHYSFVEYGGGNITHWSFLDDEGINVERLCAKLMLISDKDEGKDSRHDKLAEKLGDRFLRLSVRESENLLSPQVIKQVIQSYEKVEIDLHEFDQAKYADEYLGRFIDNNVLVDKTKSDRFGKLETCFEDKSGTVKDKVGFCRRSLKFIQSDEDMSLQAIELAERLVDFIQAENA